LSQCLLAREDVRSRRARLRRARRGPRGRRARRRIRLLQRGDLLLARLLLLKPRALDEIAPCADDEQGEQEGDQEIALVGHEDFGSWLTVGSRQGHGIVSRAAAEKGDRMAARKCGVMRANFP